MLGMIVWNEFDQIQIDQNFSCYEVISTDFVMGSAWGGTINFGGDGTYLLFARPRNISNHLGRGRISDVSTSFVWEGGNDSGWSIQGGGRPASGWQGLDYVVARPSYHAPANREGFGLTVLTSEGLAAFDSTRNYLRIKAVFRSTPGLSVEDFSLPPPAPGRKYYFCVLPLYFTRVDTDQYGDEDYYGYTAGFVGETTFRVRNWQHLYYWPGAVDQNPSTWNLTAGHRPFWIIAEY